MSELDIRYLTPDYAVSPQIDPGDLAGIARAGFTTVICNRPDTENPEPLHMAALAEAAEEAGLTFIENPFGAMGIGPQTLDRQSDAIGNSDGPVLAYCRSGTRSATIWAFSMAGRMPTDDILQAAAGAGYALEPLRVQIDALSRQG